MKKCEERSCSVCKLPHQKGGGGGWEHNKPREKMLFDEGEIYLRKGKQYFERNENKLYSEFLNR